MAVGKLNDRLPGYAEVGAQQRRAGHACRVLAAEKRRSVTIIDAANRLRSSAAAAIVDVVPGIDLDNQTIAQLYCQTVGVLAGFALTALILVLGQGEDRTRLREAGLGKTMARPLRGTVLLLLFGAFLGLVENSVAYAIMGGLGEHPGGSSAAPSDWRVVLASLHVVAGSGFGLNLLLMVAALRTLVVATSAELERFTLIIAAIVGPPLIWIYVWFGFNDLRSALGEPIGCETIYVATAAAVAAVALGVFAKWGASITYRIPDWVCGPQAVVAVSSVISLAGVIAVGFLPYFGGSATDSTFPGIWMAESILVMLPICEVQVVLLVTRERSGLQSLAKAADAA